MRTKKEILAIYEYDISIDNGGFTVVNPNDAMKAMNEYAQERAIAFAEWLSKRYAMRLQGDWMDMDNPQGSKYTTAELYDIFNNKTE